MSRRIIISLIMTLALGLSQGSLKSQGDARMAPRLLNYQGYLTDTLGNPITNPSLSITFRIYDAVTAATRNGSRRSRWPRTGVFSRCSWVC